MVAYSSYELGLFLSTIIIINFYLITTSLVFYFLRKREFITKRSPGIVFANIICCVIDINILIPSAGAFPNMDANFPCLTEFIVHSFFSNMWIFSYVIRLIHILFAYFINQMIEFSSRRDSLVDRRKSEERKSTINTFDKFCLNGLALVLLGRQNPDEMPTDSTTQFKRLSMRVFSFKGLFKSFLVWAILIVAVILIGVFLGNNDFINYSNQSRSTCYENPLFATGPIMLYLLISMCFPIGWYLIRNVNDNYYIRQEIMVVTICIGIHEVIHIWELFRRIGHPEIPPFVISIPVGVAKLLICHTVSVLLPSVYTWRSKAKTKRLLVKYDKTYFEHVLNDRVLYKKFREQVAQDLAIENVLFLEKYNKTFKLYQDTNLPVYQPHLMTIYNEFIHPSAQFQLNLPYHVYSSFKNAIAHKQLDWSNFDIVVRDVKEMLFTNNFPRFVSKQGELIQNSMKNPTAVRRWSKAIRSFSFSKDNGSQTSPAPGQSTIVKTMNMTAIIPQT